MESLESFDGRLGARAERMSPAERRVAQFFRDNREEVLIASASALAKKAGTSDATVIRTARALGFAGMEDLRRRLAEELRENLSPASRLARTLGEVGDDLAAALDVTLEVHRKALEDLRRDVTPERFAAAVRLMVAARRIMIFGIGPSSAMAEYFAIQLGRFGLEAMSLTHTGLLLADGLQRLREGDLLIIFAYSRVYREVSVLMDQVERRRLASILFTDTLASTLGDRIDLVLPVARGRANMLSMHTATLGLIEALLVGIAVKRPSETLASLGSLNALRADLVGKPMDLPTSGLGA